MLGATFFFNREAQPHRHPSLYARAGVSVCVCVGGGVQEYPPLPLPVEASAERGHAAALASNIPKRETFQDGWWSGAPDSGAPGSGCWAGETGGL